MADHYRIVSRDESRGGRKLRTWAIEWSGWSGGFYEGWSVLPFRFLSRTSAETKLLELEEESGE